LLELSFFVSQLLELTLPETNRSRDLLKLDLLFCPCYAESDQNTPLAIDAGLANITRLVAQAKGWSLEKVTA